MILYHATSRQGAEAILAHGFDMDFERRRDPGDFGWGIYFTNDLYRARCLGEVILVVTLDESGLARVTNPYFLQDGFPVPPTSPVEKLFRDLAFEGDMMLTCNHLTSQERRVEVAKTIRETFMSEGFKGIRTELWDGETVVFDSSVVLDIRRLKSDEKSR